MSYLKCFKSDFHEFVSRFIVLLFIIHGAVSSTQLGTILTSKTNYSNNESIEVSCQYNNKPADEINDYFNIRLAHRYNTNPPQTDNYTINYTDPRYDKGTKTLKITFDKLELGYYDITCSIYIKNGTTYDPTGIDIKSICVGTKPEPVENFTCINYAFDKLTCSFDAPYNPVPPVYTVEVRTGNQHVNNCGLKQNSKIKSRWECTTANPELDTPYTFIVKSENDLSEEPLSQTYYVNLLNVTVPPKVELKKNHIDIDSAEFLFPLDYSANYEHDRAKNNILNFNLTLQSKVGFHSHDQFKYSVINIGGDQFSLQLKDLPYPNYTYNVTLRSKMSLSPNDTDMYFSEPVSKIFITEPTFPYRPPRTNMGAFEIIQTGNGHCNCTIFWEALEEFEHNGPGFRYDIKVFKNNKLDSNMQPSKECESSATFEIDNKTDYLFEIVSRNDKGASSTSSQIFVSRHVTHRKPSIEDVWKVTNNKHVNLTWSLTESNEDFANFTVFWCVPMNREDYTNCKSSTKFEEISKFERSHVFHDTTAYNYGISLNFQNYSTGLVWNSCSAREDELLGTVNFRFDTPAHKRQVGLRWNANCRTKSIISGYKFTYCLLDNSNTCVDIKNTTLGNKLENYVVYDLKPYSRYKFFLGMIRGNETILYSDGISETSQAAPSPPQNLTVKNVTSSSVFLKWTRPKEMNGVFKGYKVYYNISSYTPTNYTNFTLTDLDGNTDYNLSVVAYTIEDSDHSKPENIKTKIGVPSRPKTMQFNYSSGPSNSFVANWQRPERPNGGVEFYEVSMGDRTSLVIGLNCTLQTEFCDGTQENNFKVTAVNVYPSDGFIFETGYKYESSSFKQKLCEVDDSDYISEQYKTGFAFYKSESLINNKYACGPSPWWSSVQVLTIMLSCIFVPLVAILAFIKIKNWAEIKVDFPPGLGFDCKSIQCNNATITRDDDNDGDSEQTMETTENECSTLTGKEYIFQVQEFGKVISEKPQSQFLVTNDCTPIIDNFALKDGSGYIKIQPDSGYIKIQPDSGYIKNAGGYVSFPLSEPPKIKNESEYFAIETDDSSIIPAPLMSGYVTPGGNFFK